jgi:hypothetical protein
MKTALLFASLVLVSTSAHALRIKDTFTSLSELPSNRIGCLMAFSERGKAAIVTIEESPEFAAKGLLKGSLRITKNNVEILALENLEVVIKKDFSVIDVGFFGIVEEFSSNTRHLMSLRPHPLLKSNVPGKGPFTGTVTTERNVIEPDSRSNAACSFGE